MKHEKKKAQLKENIFSISFFDKFNKLFALSKNNLL